MEHERQLLFPAGFAVGAAGHQAAGQVDAPDHDLAAHLGKFPAHSLVAAHLLGTVVHVEHRAGLQLCAAHQTAELFRRHPDRRRQGCRAAEGIVILQQGIQAHQAAHGTAANERVLPVRQGAEIVVNEGLEPVDEPAHGRLPLAVKVAIGRVIEAVGRILHKALVVGACIALHCRHDERGIGVVQIIRHAPALAVGGIRIKEHILAVEHIQHRIPALRVGFVHGGQVDIHPALLHAVHRRIADAPFFDHIPVPSRFCFSAHSLALCRRKSNRGTKPLRQCFALPPLLAGKARKRYRKLGSPNQGSCRRRRLRGSMIRQTPPGGIPTRRRLQKF